MHQLVFSWAQAGVAGGLPPAGPVNQALGVFDA